MRSQKKNFGRKNPKRFVNKFNYDENKKKNIKSLRRGEPTNIFLRNSRLLAFCMKTERQKVFGWREHVITHAEIFFNYW